MIDGVPLDPPGLATASWRDVPAMRVLPADSRMRVTRWIRSFIVHTTQGDEPQIIHPGTGEGGLASKTVRAWQQDSRHAGAHIIIDADGTVWCLADLIREATYHAKAINEVSIGIELAQTPHLETWEIQYQSLIVLLDALTSHPKIQIQRQYHAPYLGEEHAVERLADGGKDAIGIFGHRDQAWSFERKTMLRGRGDPGDEVFKYLAAAGYEAFDFERNEDKTTWGERQSRLLVGFPKLRLDGVPGPQTVSALAASGKKRGMWTARPGD
jgi:N-acetylmuramoyl-L-alanine amidase